MERLWKWADENEIAEDEIPRNKEELLELTFINLCARGLTKFPKQNSQRR